MKRVPLVNSLREWRTGRKDEEENEAHTEIEH